MVRAMTYIGVDGCKCGWLFVRLDGTAMEFGVATTFRELIAAAPDRASVFVDIPIGLRDDTPTPRSCDTTARKLLGPKRAPTVFPAPIRAILLERSHSDATSKSVRLTGKGISQQAFAIIPKIREVDALIASTDRTKEIVREVHPELCFWGLNGGQAMLHRKKTIDGFAERMAVLDRILPESERIAQEIMAKYLRRDVARDDIADALVALATAAAPSESISTAPLRPERDSRGLPMEMVYSFRHQNGRVE